MSKVLLIITMVLVVLQAASAQSSDPSGVWLTDGGDSQISVYKCGQNYCGSIVKLAEPIDADGLPQRDTNNPDPKMRSRPLVGLRILRDMAPSSGVKWQGKIYNPDDGDVYSGSIAVRGSSLEVEGCVVIIICKSQFWTRVK